MATWFERREVSVRRIEDLLALDPDIGLEEVARLLRYATTGPGRQGPIYTIRRMLRETGNHELLYHFCPPRLGRQETADLVHEMLEWSSRATKHEVAMYVGKSWSAVDICLRRTGNQKTVNRILRNTTGRA